MPWGGLLVQTEVGTPRTFWRRQSEREDQGIIDNSPGNLSHACNLDETKLNSLKLGNFCFLRYISSLLYSLVTLHGLGPQYRRLAKPDQLSVK